MENLLKDKKFLVEKILNEAFEEYQKGDLVKSIDLLKDTWNVLPSSKFSYDESFHIAKFIVKLCIEAGRMDDARTWAETVQLCNPERADIGEKEFILAQVAYEQGHEEECLKLFEVANQKSQGRCFGPHDKKYKDFYRRKQRL